MRLHFLGGANEVGASCTLIEIEGRRILPLVGFERIAVGNDRSVVARDGTILRLHSRREAEGVG